MEQRADPRRILKIPWIYRFFQEVIGGDALRRRFINEYVRARKGDKVVDIGCGPAQYLLWLPSVEYIGIDTDETYINAARKKYGGRGVFLVGSSETLFDDHRFLNADTVICSGVLHHLDDEEVVRLLKFAHKILKTGGRLVSIDSCWVRNQGILAKWIMSKDRGGNIRTEEHYRELAERVFPSVKTTINLTPMRIPTTCVIMECAK